MAESRCPTAEPSCPIWRTTKSRDSACQLQAVPEVSRSLWYSANGTHLGAISQEWGDLAAARGECSGADRTRVRDFLDWQEGPGLA